MKKTIIFTNVLFLLTMYLYSSVYALETLTPSQMKRVVAQAGVDIAIGDAVTETHLDSFRVANPDDASNQYISFNDIRYVSTFNTGTKDMNEDGSINHLSLDVGLYSNKVMFFAQSPDLNITTDIIVDSIDFSGTTIGSLFVDKLMISSFHLYMGPHGVSGIDFELGKRLSIDTIKFDYNSTDSLTFSGITLAHSFSETVHENPDTWIANDEFLIGDILNNKSASLDFTADTTASWNFVDSAGNPYSVANPRFETGYIVMNLPMEGSLRVDNINFGGNNLGSMAIDGLKVEKLYIEIPGRGLGKP